MKSTIKAILQRLKSRYYWLAILTAISANLPTVKDYLADNYTIVAFIVSVIIVALREDTKKPVTEKTKLFE